MKDKKICDCTGICGVGRTHDQIWYDFENKYGRFYDNPWDVKRIHAKWKSLGKQAAKGSIRNMTGV